jgi:osmoprotectant transport system permease protein
MTWVSDHLAELVEVTGQHLTLALLPVLIGLLIAVPLGWAAARWRVLRAVLVPAAGMLYTIPSLALFVVMPLILGTRVLDPVNIIAALTVYAVALLVRSVADALAAVPQPVVAAATAMGYRPLRRFLTVELPLAFPVLISGLRVVAVSNISLVSVGVLIGVGGLGYYLGEGFQRENWPEVIATVVLMVILAVAIDLALWLTGRLLTPWTRAGAR